LFYCKVNVKCGSVDFEEKKHGPFSLPSLSVPFLNKSKCESRERVGDIR
jgi:hypothetical protein